MARPVEIRACYRDDSSYLIRFEKAVSKDTRLNEKFRAEFIDQIHRLAMKAMEADVLIKPK